MGNVLVIDSTPLFYDFIKTRLAADKVSAMYADCNRDAFPKMISLLPDLIVLDVRVDIQNILEFLNQKRANPNTLRTPIIAFGPKIERASKTLLSQFGVVKYFTRPFMFDAFFESVARFLGVERYVDKTPARLDAHRNGTVIFIDVAQGLNRDKLSLLKFRLQELCSDERFDAPKVVCMVAGIKLTFVDALNIEYLLDSILSCKKILAKNVTVLSKSAFLRELLEGHEEYSEINFETDIREKLETLVDTSSASDLREVIAESVLASRGDDGAEDEMQTRFLCDVPGAAVDDAGSVMSVAVVDSDSSVFAPIDAEFKKIGAECFSFGDARKFREFIEGGGECDLVIIDAAMQGGAGFDLLSLLRESRADVPVIVCSSSMAKQDVVRGLSLGAKRWFAKPMHPAALAQQTLQMIRENSK